MGSRYALLFLSAVVLIGPSTGAPASSPSVHAYPTTGQPPQSVDTAGADDLYNAGVDLQAAGKYREAIESYSASMQKRMVFPDAWLSRGICYTALQQWDPAISDFTAYIQRKKDTSLGYTHRAYAYLGKKAYTEAVTDCDSSLARKPKPAEMLSVYMNRGSANIGLNHYDAAVEDFTLALKAQNQGDTTVRPRAYLGRAEAYLKMTPARTSEASEDVISASACIEKAVARNPRDSDTCYLYVQLARVKELQGDFSGAIADYETFLRRQPNHPERQEIEKQIQALKAKSGK